MYRVVQNGEVKMSILQKQIEETIATITNQFHRKPYNFFNEHEFHQYCYHVFYGKKDFSNQYTTLDGKKTNILKPEYPSIGLFTRKPGNRPTRAHYDIAILRPKFIENSNYITVVNRDAKFSSKGTVNLAAALEFKFIVKHNKEYRKEIAFDIHKLAKADEVELKYSLTFSNTIDGEMDYYRGLTIPEDMDVRYIAVWEENGKKSIRVREL